MSEEVKGNIESLRKVMGTLPNQDPVKETKFLRGVEGITVDLIDYPTNPYKAMYVLATSCWGAKIDKWAETLPEHRFLVVKAALERQALPLALEAGSYTFAVEGVSRACFDQIARTRIGAVFSAKGMRDNNWKGCSIRIPNSLWPTEDELHIVEYLSDVDPSAFSSHEKEVLEKYFTFESIKNAMLSVKDVYSHIVDSGKGSWQAARTVLPLYVVYGFSVCYTFASLMGVCANRMKFCLTDNNLIQLSNGAIKPIPEVEPGDMVLTEQGVYKPVVNTSCREYEGKILTILTSGTPECLSLQLTEGHKIMAVDTSKYRDSKGIVRKPLHKQAMSPTWIESQDIKVGDLIAYPIVTEEVDAMLLSNPVDECMARAIGYFIAEGYTTERQIYLSFGPDEQELVDDCVTCFKSAFGVNPLVRDRTIEEYKEITNTLVVEIGSVGLAKVFRTLFGVGATNKHLPEWFIRLPKYILREFYYSYKAGDGSTITVVKTSQPIEYDSFTTVSRSLAVQLKNIALKLGYYPSIGFAEYDNTTEVLGRTVNQHSKYIITVFKDTTGSKGARCFRSEDGKFMLYMVKSVSEEIMNTLVYNLEVEDIHSYTTTGQLVSNCEMEDTVATAWLYRKAIEDRFPFLASYLKPGCDNSKTCQYHKSYTLSEMFGCLFKECGRNPCKTSDGYAEFNETCTDYRILESQLGLKVYDPDKWPKFEKYEDLRPSDKALFEAE